MHVNAFCLLTVCLLHYGFVYTSDAGGTNGRFDREIWTVPEG